MTVLGSSRDQFSVKARGVVSALASVLIVWLLFGRILTEYFSYEFQTTLLRVFAKCPGLPYGQYSGGPDYINLAIDVGLTFVGIWFIGLTIRDIRRKRRGDSMVDMGDGQNPGSKEVQ